nr:MAG TPA: hypothetical protein [Caudoviricetes sp.]
MTHILYWIWVILPAFRLTVNILLNAMIQTRDSDSAIPVYIYRNNFLRSDF